MILLCTEIATSSPLLNGWVERDRAIPRPFLEQALLKADETSRQLEAAKLRMKELLDEGGGK
jgi:hypothetical protein